MKKIKDLPKKRVTSGKTSGKRRKPSDDDVKITQQLSEAGELLGIKVLDHIAFSKSGYRSISLIK